MRPWFDDTDHIIFMVFALVFFMVGLIRWILQ